jgi:type I restriction-modification system DNA methylase subunit
VENRQGFAEPYKEVIHEDAVKIGTATKAPDYSFRIGGMRKFFVEAKNPSVNLKEDISPAYQLRRYAWSAKLPLSILTDFDEFAVYDCRAKPLKTDKASTGRIQYLTYKDYVEQWELIASVFSKEGVLKGSFDKYAETAKGKKGTAEVDDAFLKEIESWRQLLAKNFALRNLKLSQRELNVAVQRTIDRLIFLRICEDRGIETYGRLLSLVNGERAYRRLCEYFYRADEKYNSGLFHFEREKGRPEEPDELTPNLHLDDKPLKEILGNLYYPDCPYEFSVLPADILGQVYEQFLGKVIRLTQGHQAKVEDKPEVKKAGGVYYTPTYIVDYIVKNTVGKLLDPEPPLLIGEGKGEVINEKPVKPLTPREASKLRILDPACGSGSFLIGAYQYLLDWHRDWYEKDGAEKYVKGRNAALFRGPGGEWRLTTAERKRILLNNIYGVDIDSQAVEVTKLSLLLKVLEGENEQTISQQLKMFHERALPDLGSNIKCGNSLIGPDFYEGKQLSLLDDEEKMRINVFDWKKEFKETMDAGGFDAVIGNPPYRMLQPHNTEEPLLDYFRRNYVSTEFKIEIFHLFLQRSASLLDRDGYLGFIIPATILNNVYAESLRTHLMNLCCIEIISVSRDKVFRDADVYTCVVVLRRELNPAKHRNHVVLTTSEFNERLARESINYAEIRQGRLSELAGGVWNVLIDDNNAPLVARLSRNFELLKDVAVINRGLITGDRGKYFSKTRKSKSHVPIIAGGDVHRYLLNQHSEYVLFERPVSAGGCWDPDVHLAPHKIVVRQIGLRPTASLLTEPIAVTGNIFTVRAGSLESECYVLGILNSRLIEFFWRILFSDFKTSFPQVTVFSLSQIPIRKLQLRDPAEKSRHDRMVELVEQMLSLHKQLPATKTAGKPAAKTDHEKTVIQRQIEATDKQIDQLVYELYGLTEEEIKIVEGKE